MQPGFVRHVKVTNQTLFETNQATIELPQLPSKEIIQQALAVYLK